MYMFTRSKSNQFVMLNEFSTLRRRKSGIYIVVFTGFSDLFINLVEYLVVNKVV